MNRNYLSLGMVGALLIGTGSRGEEIPHLAAPGRHPPRIVRLLAPRVFAPRFGFEYENPNDPALQAMRKHYRLDDVVAGATNDWEIICRLMAWTTRYVGDLNERNRGGPGCIPASEKEIQDALAAGRTPPPKGASGLDLMKQLESGSTGACGTFNRVFQSVLAAYGIMSRDLNIGPAWHAVTDVWSDHWGKWIFMDSMTCAYFESAGVPLTAFEIQLLRRAGAKPRLVLVDHGEMVRRSKWEDWVARYVDLEFQCVDTVMAANHLSPSWEESDFINGVERGAPRLYVTPFDIGRFMGSEIKIEGINRIFVTPEEHAFNNVFITRCHYVVTDDPSDVYWPLNVVEIRVPSQGRFLTVYPDVPLTLVTHAPFLEALQVSTDGGKTWSEVTTTPAVEGLRHAAFQWTVKPGINTFQARVKSAQGRLGRLSALDVMW